MSDLSKYFEETYRYNTGGGNMVDIIKLRNYGMRIVIDDDCIAIECEQTKQVVYIYREGDDLKTETSRLLYVTGED